MKPLVKPLGAPEPMSRIQKELLIWYGESQRSLPWRKTSDPYRIWVSEVMLQQTQVKTVIPYYKRFLSAFPAPEMLAEADLQEVLKIWEGLGYYARARNLHRAARELMANHGGVIPERRTLLKTLPGIGDYIAAAVSSIAFGKPHAAVDGNVKRVLARFHKTELPVNDPASGKVFKVAAEAFLEKSKPGEFNQAMMELGALVCTPRNPRCHSCPLARGCRAFKEKGVSDYPRRVKKARIPEYHIAVGVVWKGPRVLITQRKPDGLLGGLWEFPGGKIKDGETPSGACTREIREEVNLVVETKERIARIRHAYTHFKIVMDVFRCTYQNGRVRLREPVDFRWVRLHEIDRFPFPGANRKFIPLIKSHEKDLSTTIQQSFLTTEIQSRLENLPAARRFIRQFCKNNIRRQLPEEEISQLELAFHEVASNIIRHSYRNQEDQRIHIEIQVLEEQVMVRLNHWGKPFTQMKSPPKPVLDGTGESGFGLYLIERCVDQVIYERTPTGKNTISLLKQLKDAVSG